MMSSTQARDTERLTIDPLIQRLLEQVINSSIKLHLVLLFHENPRMEASARQIIQRIFRDIWSTQAALRELAHDGILGVSASASDQLYYYRPRPEHREPIARLVERYDDPFARDQIHAWLHEIESDVEYRRSLAHGIAEETACPYCCAPLYNSTSFITR